MDRILANRIKHGCAVFDGSTGYVEIANHTSLQISSGTIELWIKSNGDNSNVRSLSTKQFAYGLFTNTGYLSVYDWPTATFIKTDKYIVDGIWHHVVFTFNSGVVNGSNLYLNGEHVSNLTYSVGSDNTGNFKIANNNSQFFAGSIDEVRIWNYARTDEQIRENYTKTLKPQTGLVAYYKLDGNALDSSGLGNDGTAHGGVTWSESVADELEKHKVVSSGLMSLSLDGVNDYVKVNNHDSLTVPEHITLECWALIKKGNEYQALVRKDETYLLQVHAPTGTIRPHLWLSSNMYIIDTTTKLQLERWNHLALTYNGSVMIIYLNGIEIQRLDANGTINNHLNELFIGSTGGTHEFVNGNISLVKLWNKALTPGEINESMWKFYPSGTANLVEQWVLNGNPTGTHGNNGTLYNGVSWSFDSPTRRLLTSRSNQPYALRTQAINQEYIEQTNRLTGMQAFTVELVVKLNSLPETGTVYLFGPHGNSQGFSAYVGSSNVFNVYGTEGTAAGTGFGKPVVGEWNHFVFTVDTTGIRILRNGSVVQDRTDWTLEASDPPATLKFSTFAGGTHFADADIARIRIWNTGKTIAEAQGLLIGKDTHEANLVTHYEPNYLSRETVKDLSPAKNDGILKNGVSSVPSTAPVGQRSGLRFDGVDDVVSGGSASELNIGGTAITGEAWIYPTAYQDRGTIVTKSGAHFFQIHTDGTLQGYLQGPSSVYFASTATVPLNKWNHVAYTYDGESYKFYINGVLDSSHALTGEITTTSTTPLYMGKDGVSRLFKGIISSVRLWNKTLTQAEIKTNMHRYLLASTPNLVEQWKLNEGVGTIAYGTKGNDGTITGASWTTPSLMNWKGKSVKLDGVDDYINCGANDSLHIIGDLTIEAWIKPVIGTGLKHIVRKQASYTIRVNGNSLESWIYTDTWVGLVVPDVIIDSVWQHVAMSYDGVILKSYVNGVEVGSVNTSGNINKNTNILAIGANFFGSESSEYFNGILDEVRIWNTARTQAEIQANMYRTIERHPNLVLNMGFESDYYDASGYGNRGTPVNGPVIEDTDNDKLLLNAPIN
jgi:hypothetical protein